MGRWCLTLFCLATLWPAVTVGVDLPPTLPRWRIETAADALPARLRGLTVSELTALAFPSDAAPRFRRHDRAPWVVVSDQSAIDPTLLLPELDRVYQQVRRDFPFLGDARQPAVVLLFSDRATAHGFVTRLAERVKLRLDLPSSYAAFAFLGIGVVWTEQIPAAQLTKVIVHEAVHALTQQLFDIDRVPSWFAEGVAERAELLVHATNVDATVRALLAAQRIPPLSTLLDARHLPGHGYLPAALLIDWLLADPLRRSQLPQCFRDAQQDGAPGFLPLLERRMGLSADDLERGWRQWLTSRFGATP